MLFVSGRDGGGPCHTEPVPKSHIECIEFADSITGADNRLRFREESTRYDAADGSCRSDMV